MSYLSVGDVTRQLRERYGARGLSPKHITQLFYEGRLRDDLCPVVAGRRLIPPEYLDVIAMELRRVGKLPRLKAVIHASR